MIDNDHNPEIIPPNELITELRGLFSIPNRNIIEEDIKALSDDPEIIPKLEKLGLIRHDDLFPIFTPGPMITGGVFSYFKAPIKNTSPYKPVTLPQVYEVIRDPVYFGDQTRHLRSIQDPKEAKEYKAKVFDYVTFSGTFTQRGDKYLVNHSGLICLDFDKLEDTPKTREMLLQAPEVETELLFISPSGDGLKWVVSIDLSAGSHLQYFQAIKHYVEGQFSLAVDKSGKDVSRACFLPHDPDCFINPKHLK